MKLDRARYNCGMFASIKYRLIGEESNRESIKRRRRVSQRALLRGARNRETESKRNNNFLRFATCEFVWISCILFGGERERLRRRIFARAVSNCFSKRATARGEISEIAFRLARRTKIRVVSQNRFILTVAGVNCVFRVVILFSFTPRDVRSLAGESVYHRQSRHVYTIHVRTYDGEFYAGEINQVGGIRANIISIELPRLIVRK